MRHAIAISTFDSAHAAHDTIPHISLHPTRRWQRPLSCTMRYALRQAKGPSYSPNSRDIDDWMEAHPEHYQGSVEDDDKSWRWYIEEMRLNSKFFAFLPSSRNFFFEPLFPQWLWRLLSSSFFLVSHSLEGHVLDQTQKIRNILGSSLLECFRSLDEEGR